MTSFRRPRHPGRPPRPSTISMSFAQHQQQLFHRDLSFMCSTWQCMDQQPVKAAPASSFPPNIRRHAKRVLPSAIRIPATLCLHVRMRV
mmetsp:Transcript_34263/g.98708  ORF Transcript_34263/g.98708 Transcript_34263/m.98708 type:complete len:89 (-) Transcript_34263:820-1086(-)